MEELLPLIIGVLWLVYTFYSRGQKKRAGKQPVEAKSREKEDPTFLEQLLGAEGIRFDNDETEILEEEVPVPQQTAEPKVRKGSTPFLNSELSDYKKEGQSQFYDRIKNKTYSGFIQEDDFPFEEDEESVDFNLRDAVIYSTILDAPYINYK